MTDEEVDPEALEAWWLGLPALGNALSIVPWFRLLLLPAGTVYDQVGPFLFCLFIAVGTLILGLFGVSFALFRARKFARGLWCSVFSLTPFITGLGTAFALSTWRGITVPLLHSLR